MCVCVCVCVRERGREREKLIYDKGNIANQKQKDVLVNKYVRMTG